jgi:HD superfamily phosphohydrolase YqeK
VSAPTPELTLHPLVVRAAAGDLPAWAVASPERREHMERVAVLLSGWAGALGLDATERTRWTALGYLHDALRDADGEALRRHVPADFATLPGSILHGPAAAERLRSDGVRDEALLLAVSCHTLGHARLGREGRALYSADFLEPGRRGLRDEWRSGLRARMPDAMADVVREILAARIQHLIEGGRPVRPETIGFWNSMASER